MGAHNLVVSEITIAGKGKKGKAYLDEVQSEFDDIANEGTKSEQVSAEEKSEK